jgi:DNA-directed RNA polymerase subunit M/transcription elongation factor TFIIS
MRFCDKCGSRMREEKNDFLCPKCGNVVHAKGEARAKNVKKTEQPNSIYVVSDEPNEHAKATQVCPKCGNTEAFYWYSGISGEHAGVRREATIEHFRCTKCSHTWNMSS